MKRYLKFYNLLRLTTPTREGVVYMLAFTILNIIIYDKFITMTDMFTVGFAVIFIWTLFVSIYYAYLTHTNPTHAIYQFPLTAKERVRNHYISPMFLFVVVSLGLVLFGFTMVGLFSLFGNTEGDTLTDPFYLEGTIYSLGYLLIIYSIYMPTSFMLDKKKRYIVGAAGLLLLTVFNYLVVLIVTGSFELSWSIPVFMENSSGGLLVSIAVLVISLLTVFGSYKYSLRIVKYD